MVTLKLEEGQETKYIALLTENDREILANVVYGAMQLADENGKKERADRLEKLFNQFQSLNH